MLPQEEEKEEGEMPMLGKETHYWMDTWARVAQEVRVNGICENSVLTCLRKSVRTYLRKSLMCVRGSDASARLPDTHEGQSHSFVSPDEPTV